jgi:hypothetical protein
MLPLVRAGTGRHLPARGDTVRTQEGEKHMSAERGWIGEPPPTPQQAMEQARQRWIDHHRELGHEPYAAPTAANPELWKCRCVPDASGTENWRILTPVQVKQKFDHLRRSAIPRQA